MDILLTNTACIGSSEERRTPEEGELPRHDKFTAGELPAHALRVLFVVSDSSGTQFISAFRVQ